LKFQPSVWLHGDELVLRAPKDKQEMFSSAACRSGQRFTFFDTAEFYGPLVNEELWGRDLLPFA